MCRERAARVHSSAHPQRHTTHSLDMLLCSDSVQRANNSHAVARWSRGMSWRDSLRSSAGCAGMAVCV